MRRIIFLLVVLSLTLAVTFPAFAATSVTIPIAHYDARGNDNLSANLNDEYVIFKNNTTKSIVMTGWKVQDKGAINTY